VAEDCAGEFAAWLFAVKSAVDFLTQFFDFSGIVRVCHSLGKFGQLFTGQLAFSRQFKSKLNDPGLFAGRQLLDFINDGGCGHAQKILEIPPHSNAFFKSFRLRHASVIAQLRRDKIAVAGACRALAFRR